MKLQESMKSQESITLQMPLTLQDKLQILRKQNGYSQEQLADKLGIARQTISKWENGQAVPELNGLIGLSDLYGITVDQLVKKQDLCSALVLPQTASDNKQLAEFLVCAKKNTYAAKAKEVPPSRLKSGLSLRWCRRISLS